MVRIRGSHPRDPGSSPGDGTCFSKASGTSSVSSSRRDPPLEPSLSSFQSDSPVSLFLRVLEPLDALLLIILQARWFLVLRVSCLGGTSLYAAHWTFLSLPLCMLLIGHPSLCLLVFCFFLSSPLSPLLARWACEGFNIKMNSCFSSNTTGRRWPARLWTPSWICDTSCKYTFSAACVLLVDMHHEFLRKRENF